MQMTFSLPCGAQALIRSFTRSLKRFQFSVHISLVVKVLDVDALYTFASPWPRPQLLPALRLSEGARLQSSSSISILLLAFEVTYRGMATIKVVSCNNDQGRKGSFITLASAARVHGWLKLVHQLRGFMEEAGTVLRSGCLK